MERLPNFNLKEWVKTGALPRVATGVRHYPAARQLNICSIMRVTKHPHIGLFDQVRPVVRVRSNQMPLMLLIDQNGGRCMVGHHHCFAFKWSSKLLREPFLGNVITAGQVIRPQPSVAQIGPDVLEVIHAFPGSPASRERIAC